MENKVEPIGKKEIHRPKRIARNDGGLNGTGGI